MKTVTVTTRKEDKLTTPERKLRAEITKEVIKEVLSEFDKMTLGYITPYDFRKSLLSRIGMEGR